MQSKSKQALNKIQHLILLQNLFCVNRSHWLEEKFYKILGNIMFCISVTIVIGLNIFYINDITKIYILPHSSLLFAYSFKYLLLAEVIPLTIAAKVFNIYKKLKVLEEKFGNEPTFIIKNQLTKQTTDTKGGSSKGLVILSVLSVIVDFIGLIMLEYPATVVVTLPVSFAAYDTELLLYSFIVKEFNAKLATIIEVNAEVGTRIYRHILIAASHFSEDFRFTICLTVIMSVVTTVFYIGAAVVIEGPRTHKVLSYLMYRELRSWLSLCILCAASFQTRILCMNLIKRLTERLVFELETKDKSSRELTKRWLACAKSLRVRYLTNSAFTLSPALPLTLLDYATNYLLIIVQVYPLIK